MPIIPALGRWKQEDCKFETNLSCIVRACQKSESKKEGRKERRKEGGKEGRKGGYTLLTQRPHTHDVIHLDRPGWVMERQEAGQRLPGAGVLWDGQDCSRDRASCWGDENTGPSESGDQSH
jgi:hypothetical protein